MSGLSNFPDDMTSRDMAKACQDGPDVALRECECCHKHNVTFRNDDELSCENCCEKLAYWAVEFHTNMNEPEKLQHDAKEFIANSDW